MKVRIKQYDEYVRMVELQCDNPIIGTHVVPIGALYDAMEIIKDDIERMNETCEFVIVDYEP